MSDKVYTSSCVHISVTPPVNNHVRLVKIGAIANLMSSILTVHGKDLNPC